MPSPNPDPVGKLADIRSAAKPSGLREVAGLLGLDDTDAEVIR
jgi:hypothetical protein